MAHLLFPPHGLIFVLHLLAKPFTPSWIPCLFLWTNSDPSLPSAVTALGKHFPINLPPSVHPSTSPWKTTALSHFVLVDTLLVISFLSIMSLSLHLLLFHLSTFFFHMCLCLLSSTSLLIFGISKAASMSSTLEHSSILWLIKNR